LPSSEPTPPHAGWAALASLQPVIVFYAVEQAAGTRAAVLASLVTTTAEVGWTRWRHGRVPHAVALSGALVVLLGVPALLTDDPRFVLWGPVVGDVVFAAVLLGAHALGAPLLTGAAMEQLPPEDRQPVVRRWLDGVGLRMAGGLLVHAAWSAWAVDQPREVWTLVTSIGQWVVLGAQLVGEAAWARARVFPALAAADGDPPGGPTPAAPSPRPPDRPPPAR
jgi:hypothetical protein